MARGNNQITVVGQVFRDPKVGRENTPYAHFTVSHSEKARGASAAPDSYVTTYFSCVAFGVLVDIIERFVKDKTMVMISGKLVPKELKTKVSQESYTGFQLMVRELTLMDSKPDSAGETNGAAYAAAGARQAPPTPIDTDNDGIPF